MPAPTPSRKNGPHRPPHRERRRGPWGRRRRPRGLRHLRMALWTIGDFAPCAAREFRPLRRATKGSAFGNRDLGNAPPVGKRCRRGILCQSKASFAAILDVWQEAGPQLWRKRPGDTRRHTGGKLPYRKNRVKLLSLFPLLWVLQLLLNPPLILQKLRRQIEILPPGPWLLHDE